MKQLTNFTLNGMTSVQEFKDEVSINGTLYNKSTLTSNGINNAETYCDTNNNGVMVLERSLQIVDKVSGRFERTKNIVVDSNNPNIVYCVRSTDGPSGYHLFQKWERGADGKYFMHRNLRWGGAPDTYYYCPQFHTYQNSKFLYVYSGMWATNAWSGHYWRLNKDTWAYTHSHTLSNSGTAYLCHPCPIYEDANNIYFWHPSRAYDETYGGLVVCAKHMNEAQDPFVYSNRTAAVFESNVFPEEIKHSFRAYSNGIIPSATCVAHDDPRSFYYLRFKENETQKGFLVDILVLTLKPEINRVSDTVVVKTIINSADYNLDVGPGSLQLEYVNDVNIIHTLNTFISEGHKYIVMANYQRPLSTSGQVTQLQFYKLIVFEDIGNDKLEVKSVTQAPVLPFGYLTNKDMSRFVLIGANSVYNMAWNQSSESYECGKPINIVPYQIGFDMDSKLWVLDTNKKLYVEDLSEADSVKIEFLDVSDYDSFGIVPYGLLRVTQKNMNGRPISSKVNIKLNGAVYFLDGSSNKNVIIDSTGVFETQVRFGEATAYEAIVTQIK